MTYRVLSVSLLLSLLVLSASCVTVRCYDDDGVFGTPGQGCSDESE